MVRMFNLVDGPNNGATLLLRDEVRDALKAVNVILEGVALIFRGRDGFDAGGAVVGDTITGAVKVGDTVGSISECDETVVGASVWGEDVGTGVGGHVSSRACSLPMNHSG